MDFHHQEPTNTKNKKKWWKWNDIIKWFCHCIISNPYFYIIHNTRGLTFKIPNKQYARWIDIQTSISVREILISWHNFNWMLLATTAYTQYKLLFYVPIYLLSVNCQLFMLLKYTSFAFLLLMWTEQQKIKQTIIAKIVNHAVWLANFNQNFIFWHTYCLSLLSHLIWNVIAIQIDWICKTVKCKPIFIEIFIYRYELYGSIKDFPQITSSSE